MRLEVRREQKEWPLASGEVLERPAGFASRPRSRRVFSYDDRTKRVPASRNLARNSVVMEVRTWVAGISPLDVVGIAIRATDAIVRLDGVEPSRARMLGGWRMNVQLADGTSRVTSVLEQSLNHGFALPVRRVVDTVLVRARVPPCRETNAGRDANGSLDTCTSEGCRAGGKLV